MAWISFLGLLLLAAVFLVAAIGKLMDRGAWRQALKDFGIPAPVITPIAVVLPAGEIAVAVLLLLPASSRLGALGALALLGIFTVTIVINLVRGRRPDCHCFGQIRSEPIGPSTVTRNVVLAGVAAMVVWQGGVTPPITFAAWGPNAVAWIALVVAVVALAVVAIETWFLLGALPQQGRLLMRLEALEAKAGLRHVNGLPVGTRAPDFELADLTGERVTLASLWSSGRPVLLFFTNPHCAPCDELLPKVARWQRDYAARTSIVVITKDSPELNRKKAAQHQLQTVLLQKQREVAEAYEVESTPAAILIDADGAIASEIAYGPENIEGLLTHMRAPIVGQAAPALLLPDLDGKPRPLVNGHGGATLLLFWSPDCGFCQKFLPELKAWERQRPTSSPQLVIVSNGNVESNRAMGLLSPVVLDAEGSAMREFGATGTPMAVLIERGRIASSMVAGAQQVMRLAQRPSA